MIAPIGADILRVAVVRLPRLSNVTDFDPLMPEPGVAVKLATRPADLEDADVVILPGTRATVSDLAWLRLSGLSDAIAKRVAEGKLVLGSVAVFRCLLGRSPTTLRAQPARLKASRCLPTCASHARKPLRIRGVLRWEQWSTATRFIMACDGRWRRGVSRRLCEWLGMGHHLAWHLRRRRFRRAFLTMVTSHAGRGFAVAPDVSFIAVRENRLGRVGRPGRRGPRHRCADGPDQQRRAGEPADVDHQRWLADA